MYWLKRSSGRNVCETMSAFSSILTTAAVLIHSVLGCCWHHSHQCEWDGVSGVPQSAEQSRLAHQHRGCSHHHRDTRTFTRHESDNHRQRESGGGDSSDHGHCDGGGCVFVSIVPTDARSRTVWPLCLAPVDEVHTLASVLSQSASMVLIDTERRRTSGSSRALTQVGQV
jgi:hypothetical protein